MRNKKKINPIAEISVIIPCFNEQGGILSVIEDLQSNLKASGLKHEIIVVDDVSTDSTGDIAVKAGAVVVEHSVNRGYGAAIKSGVRVAQYDHICITDGDGTYPSKVIPDLVSAVSDGADMAVGSRTGAIVKIPLIRRPAKFVITKIAESIAGISIPDLNSGLRVFKKSHVKRYSGILPNGFSFTTTITLALLTNGFRVDYMAIDYESRIGDSKIRPISDTINFVTLILRMALYFAPLKFFMPASFICILVAIAWALVSRFALGQLADVTSTILVVLGIQIAVVGLLAEMINKRLPAGRQD